MDGELVDWDDATVHVLTPTLHYGYGVFEGIRAYATDRGRRLPAAAAHRTAVALGGSTRRSTPIPYSVDDL
jgi:branched-chain amino acid aminotransferase